MAAPKREGIRPVYLQVVPWFFLQDAIPERGVLRWFPVRSAEVSSASRTPHSLESPHTTAYPSKERGWSTKEFTGVYSGVPKVYLLDGCCPYSEAERPSASFHSRSLWQLRDSANQFVHGLMPSNHHRVKHLLRPTTASAPFPCLMRFTATPFLPLETPPPPAWGRAVHGY